eukprot:PLAT3280.15.p1 GENE.PLAT3280.15~~PLAT3280.15.p1  ORF type:complete len:435 (-),score=147.51 PLAT3280.15:87-1391(-)
MMPPPPPPGRVPVGVDRTSMAKKGGTQLDWARKMESRPPPKRRMVTRDELEQHYQEGDAWCVIQGKVYDISEYAAFHPGGVSEIMRGAGMDATSLFESVHRWVSAERLLGKCMVGVYDPRRRRKGPKKARSFGGARAAASGAAAAAPAASARGSGREGGGGGGDSGSGAMPPPASSVEGGTPAAALHKRLFRPFKLLAKEQVAVDAWSLTFELPAGCSAGYFAGQHVQVSMAIGGSEVVRPYTPVSSASDSDTLELIVKTYDGGVASCALAALDVGGRVLLRGPLGGFAYMPPVDVAFMGGRRSVKQIVMLSAGSGVTPMLQICRTAAAAGSDMQLTVLCGHRREEQIISRPAFDALAAASDGRMTVAYYLSQPSDEWEGGRGRIGIAALKESLPAPDVGDDLLVLICGNFKFNRTMDSCLDRLGYSDSQRFEM